MIATMMSSTTNRPLRIVAAACSDVTGAPDASLAITGPCGSLREPFHRRPCSRPGPSEHHPLWMTPQRIGALLSEVVAACAGVAPGRLRHAFSAPGLVPWPQRVPQPLQLSAQAPVL